MLQQALSSVYGPPYDPNAVATPQNPSLGGSAPATGGMAVMSPTLRTQMQNDPRLAMVAMFAKNGADTSPAKGGWGEAIARALTGAIAGHQEKQIDDEYSQAQTSRNAALKDALSQTDPTKTVAALAANPSTADIAAEYGGKLFDLNAANAAKGNTPLTPFERAELGGEQQVNAQTGEIVPKYSLSAVNTALHGVAGLAPVAGGAPAGGMGAGGMAGGQDGILPPPAVLTGAPGAAPQAVGGATGGMAASNSPINPVTPKALSQTQEAVGKNLADIAAPAPDKDPVASLNSTLVMLNDAAGLNEKTLDTQIKNQANQWTGRIFGDQALDQPMTTARDAASLLDQKNSAIAAEAVKPLFGSAQLSDADREAAKVAASALPAASQGEKRVLYKQLGDVLERKRDLQSMSQEYAKRGQTVPLQAIQNYYASKGVDYQTGKRIDQPAAPAGAQAQQPAQQAAPVRVNSPADALKLPKGTQFVDPNGVTRVVP